MKKKFAAIFFNYRTLLVVFALAAVIISIQSYSLGVKKYEKSPIEYTHYNNYLIFKQSFFHLIENKDLYASYPNEHWDLYKYSPTFALMFAPLAYCPDIVGLILWNLLNAISLLLAIKYLPNFNDKKKLWMLWFVFIELTTCVHNHQSNGIMAALLIFSFGFFERKQLLLATLCIVLSIYVKLFGAVALVLILFYPDKLKSILYTGFWMLSLWALPLLVTSFHHLVKQYESWGCLVSNDPPAQYALGVLGWLKTWFGFTPSNLWIVFTGLLLFCLPLVRINLYKLFNFRLLVLASILLWVVIFNHKAEKPTYIIAIAGIALWYFGQPGSRLNTVLMIAALLFTQLSATDLFPKMIRDDIIRPYVVKAVPCILIWCKLLYDMAFFNKKQSENYMAETIEA